MRISSRFPLHVGATCLVLTVIGCDDTSADPRRSSAHIELLAQSCDERLLEQGTLIYVVRQSDCNPAAETVAFIERQGDGSTNVYEITPGNGADSTAVDFKDSGHREITVFQSGTWREIPNPNSWQPRDGAGLLVLGGRAYLLGGWLYGPLTNEVWVSDNLVDWKFLGFAPWKARHGSAWLVHHDRLYVIGGEMLTDVWSSADGVNWRLENADAPFGKRYTPNSASLNGRIYVYAGLRWLGTGPNGTCVAGELDCQVEGFNDVWQSSDDGRTWELVQPAAPWEPRALVHGSVVHDGEIYVIGGGLKVVPPGGQWAETSAEFTDVWSSRDGKNWTLRSAQLPFPGRTHFSVLNSSLGCVVSDGSVGTQVNVSNDVYIAPDCMNFTPLPSPPLPARHASSMAEFNGTIVILGGPPAGGAGTAIWQYVP